MCLYSENTIVLSVCVCMSSMHIHICAWENLSCEAALSSSCSLEAGSLTESGTRMVVHEPQGCSCVPLLKWWVYRHSWQHPASYVSSGIWAQVLTLSHPHPVCACVYRHACMCVYMHTSIVSLVDQKLDPEARGTDSYEPPDMGSGNWICNSSTCS